MARVLSCQRKDSDRRELYIAAQPIDSDVTLATFNLARYARPFVVKCMRLKLFRKKLRSTVDARGAVFEPRREAECNHSRGDLPTPLLQLYRQLVYRVVGTFDELP